MFRIKLHKNMINTGVGCNRFEFFLFYFFFFFLVLHFSDKLKEIQNGEGLLPGSSAAAADDDVEFVLHAKVTFSS